MTAHPQERPAGPDRSEFAHYLRLAQTQGWSIPDPGQDSHGPAAWLGYWRALAFNLVLRRTGQRVTGRPIQPHTVGGGARLPEDHFERAQRINRNRELWRGYLI